MIEVVVNQLSADGMKFVRVISDRVVSEAWMQSIVPSACFDYDRSTGLRSACSCVQVKCYDTAALSLFYGEVTYPLRGVVEVAFSDQLLAISHPRVRRLAAWRMVESEGYRMSEIIEFLGQWYFMQTKRKPQYAFVRSLPKGVERFTEVDGLMLLDADWCLEKTVMVGG